MENNLKIISEMLEKLDTKSAMDDFLKSFQMALDVFKQLKQANEKEREEIILTLQKAISEFNSFGLYENEKNKKKIEETLTKLKKGQEKILKSIKDKLAKIKEGTDGEDGKDADEEKIIEEVLAKIPEVEKETGKEIVEKINELEIKPDLQIDKEHIKGLMELLEKLEKKINEKTKTTFVGGGNGGGGHIVKSYDLSASLNGVLKTFSLPAFWRVISVHSSSFPNAFRETTDYTVDGSAMTITFTSEITASTTLNTGQTIIVVYAEP